MSNVSPFEQILGLGLIGTLTSIMNINEGLKFLILILTFAGLVVKLWEQIKKSDFFLQDVKNLWKKIKQK